MSISRYCNDEVYRDSEYCKKCLQVKSVQDTLEEEGKPLPVGIEPYVRKRTPRSTSPIVENPWTKQPWSS
jgi:hypothetical protein